MKRSHAAVLLAAIISIIALLGKALLGIFFAVIGVFSGGIGILLLMVFGVASLLLSGRHYEKVRRFALHRAQARTVALLMILGAVVWLLVLLVPALDVVVEEATMSRPLWQALLLLAASFVILLKAVDVAVEKAEGFAAMVGVSPFIVSFFIVGIVSALPESTIAVMTNLRGDTDAAAGALLSSNVADLALVFGVMALLLRGVAIRSDALKRDALYLPLLLLPLILMFDGALSRVDGIILLSGGLLFFSVIASHVDFKVLRWPEGSRPVWTLLALLASLAVMLLAANTAVSSAADVGVGFGLSGVIVNAFVVGIGVCLPELLFAIKSVWQKQEGLAMGNVLSVVMIDATIMLGVTALVRPMVVDADLFLLTNVFMALAALSIIYFARRLRKVGWREGLVLLSLYAVYVSLLIAR